MVLKHRILFALWRVWGFMLGYRVGSILYIYSEEKEKLVKGCVTGFNGISITSKIGVFSIRIEWFEPLQGDTFPHFCKGFYSIKDAENNLCTSREEFKLREALS